MATLSKLAAWHRTLRLPWRRWRVVGRVDSAADVPEKLPYRGVMLAGRPQQPAWAALDCPCNTGHRLLVNLDSRRYPHWELDPKPRLSLRPSIDNRARDMRCHFVLNNGKVRWVRSRESTGLGVGVMRPFRR